MIRVVAVAAFGLALQACSARVGDQREAYWDREGVDAKKVVPEKPVGLPTYPQDADLVEFSVGPAGSHRYFIDAKTLAVGADGVVRYALVVKSAGGAASASYEGIRCSEKTYRIYATGAGGQWTSRPTAWRPIEPRSIQRWHNALWREYFCPLGNPIHSAAEGVDALRRGDHASRRPISD